MKRVIVDTNTVVGFLVRSEILFEEALRAYDEVILPTQVVFETVYVLQKQYGVDRLEIVEGICKLLQRPKVMSERTMLFNTLFMFRDVPNLSLVDCYLIELSSEMGCKVLTGDGKIIKRFK